MEKNKEREERRNKKKKEQELKPKSEVNKGENYYPPSPECRPNSPSGIDEDILASMLTTALVPAAEKKPKEVRTENGRRHKGQTRCGLRDRF